MSRRRRHDDSQRPERPLRPPMRGWAGRGRGRSVWVQAPDEWRGTTVQVCGLWPFSVGAGTPMIGVPLGRHIHSGATLCCDPISWFQRAKLISNPSAFVLGKPGLGKALDVDTVVPTPTGYTTMGDLHPGDFVLSPSAAPVAVVAVSEVMHNRPCWELTFSTGETIVADAQHQWLTATEREWSRCPLPAPRRSSEPALAAAGPAGPPAPPAGPDLPGGEAGGGPRVRTTEQLAHRPAHQQLAVPGPPGGALRYITGVRRVASRPVRCIQVASDDGLFLVGRSYITTHNSTIARRMATGLAGYGVMPLVLGDLKPDYVDLIEALGGQVITLGRGRGHLNVLDPGEATEAADRLRATGHHRQATQVMADAHGRRHTMVSALLTILRAAPPTDREETILDRALKVLDDRHPPGRVPVLADLLRVIQDGPDEVRAVALDRGRTARYQQITEGLEASLIGLVGGGRLGETFSAPTTNPMRRDAPVVYDVSAIDDAEMDLQAATLLACWSAGFGTVNVANALADAGLEPRRHYFVILDELWRALRAGRGMVDRVDALTRLNRQRGVGMAMISHTMSDLLALPSEADRMKARGFVERSGMVICGGLPSAEMPQLTAAVPFSRAEQDLLIGWQDPPAWDPSTGREAEPPGRGKFLVKVGGRPGIPIDVQLTPAELSINDTNKLWHEQSRVGRRLAVLEHTDPTRPADVEVDR
jgi:hypothetical protein